MVARIHNPFGGEGGSGAEERNEEFKMTEEE
jgi:hypothetical protein